MKTRPALLLPLLALTACSDNNASLYVAALCSMPEDPAQCTFPATCEAQHIGYNTIDVADQTTLWLMIEVHNQLPNNEKLPDGRTNTNDAFVREYEVEYAGGVLPSVTGTIIGSARVPAEGTAVISVQPIREAAGNTLRGAITTSANVDLVARLRLKGVYGDTTAFETGDFQLAIRACRDCVPTLTCAAGEVPVYCPPGQAGQVPGSAKCATP